VTMPIRILGDPVLKLPAKPVVDFDRALGRLADEMIEAMYAANGVGLAAPQVGLSVQVFTYDDGETGPRFLANPELLHVEGESVLEEGCLSIPGPYYPTARAEHVRIVGRDLKGKPVELEADGLLARIFQHETDHLHGLLYIDRLDEAGRREVLAELRRIELGLAEPRERRTQS
jgi:peptide deformylase